MPIVETCNGDLITLAKDGAFTDIGHGANCQNVMGAGIAPQIVRAFPEAGHADKATIAGDLGKLGSYSRGYNAEYDIHVWNLYTQFHFLRMPSGRINLDYDAVKSAFERVNHSFSNDKNSGRFGIPQIGSGLAGGDWERIKDIINDVTPNLNIVEVIYGG